MPPSVQELRALLATRFPEKPRVEGGFLSTEVKALDDAMGGGLPRGRVAEWVVGGASTGGQLALVQLILATRRQHQRVALVDATDAFAPEVLPEGFREHLIWIRGQGLATALAATDLLLHDGNFPLVVLDVRDIPLKELQRWPATGWYRLQRAAEESRTALLVCSSAPLVPATAVRLTFQAPAFTLPDRLRPSAQLVERLRPERARGHGSFAPRQATG